MIPTPSDECPPAKEAPSSMARDEERRSPVAVMEEETKAEKGWSEIRLAVEELSSLKKPACPYNEEEEQGIIPTLTFLGLSNILLLILDKVGPTMVVLRQDIQRNIERLQEIYVSNPSAYSSLVEILNKETGDGTARKGDSCSKAVLWLTRSLEFSVALLERLGKETDLRLAQVVDEAYQNTLKPWHGWISSAAYRVALKLIPEREIFISLLLGKGQDYETLRGDIKNLVSLLQPFLDEVHAILRKFRLDRMKAN